MENVIGIIGGSGLYQIEGLTNTENRTVETPYGMPSDQIITGTLEGRKVAFLPRHGKGHRIAPNELNHRANIFALKKLGVQWIVSVSAVGSLQEENKPGDFVLPDQFLDNLRTTKNQTLFGNGIVAHVSMAQPVSLELSDIIHKEALKLGLTIHSGGTYVNMEGPAFSTRAESIRNHNAGYSVIGMTNMGEARCAREAEIAYATIAMVTDYDAWRENEDAVSVEMIINTFKQSIESARMLIKKVIPKIPTEANWPCHSALKNTILTQREYWPEDLVEKLRPILGKYL